jgi:FtsP/CotA-like multicopper oxidase with cupredoxin domain
MRVRVSAACALSLFLTTAPRQAPHRVVGAARAVDRIAVNDNRSSAGTLVNRVLTVRLEAREGEWHPDGDRDPGLDVRAFAEEGRTATIPGPLIRVPEGTEIHAFVRNSLRDSTLVVQGLSSRGAATSFDADTIQIKPSAVREVRFVAGTAGTYYYRGTTNSGMHPTRGTIDSELVGALIVDPRGTAGPPRDRVFVIGLWSKIELPGGLVGRDNLLRFTINGKAWPNTERLSYTVGDTVRFRIVNASIAVHPMHLHGFYFNVESRGDGLRDSTFDPTGSPHRVVTERAAPGRTFTMSWVPERPGNWMFHCHDNYHVLRNAPLDGSRMPAEHEMHVQNHALEMMGGLVMGIEVRDSGVAQTASEPPARRRLRLVASIDSGGTAAEPAFRYVLQDRDRKTPASDPLLTGPTILLKRGEPVSITVVNHLSEATAVHWHGIELDSYYDGVAGFAGHPGRIAPAIAPRDSFEARFTPPRAGTFIYHPHADEVRQQQGGLSGAIVVVDSLENFNLEHDIVLLITAPRLAADAGIALLNGAKTPAARELRVGQRYRLRVVNIHTFRPSMILRVMRDSTLITWRAIAKDGMDLPRDQATMRPATVQLGNGETYDYEFIPTAPGDLRLTISSGAGALLQSMPIRIR